MEFFLSCYMDLSKSIYKFVCMNSSKDIVTWGRIAHNCIILSMIDLLAVTMDFSKLIHGFFLSCYMDLSKSIYKFVCMNSSKDIVTWGRIAHNCILLATIDLRAVAMENWSLHRVSSQTTATNSINTNTNYKYNHEYKYDAHLVYLFSYSSTSW